MGVNFTELEKLRDRVLKYPKQYRQEFWGYGSKSGVVREQKPACKTAGCLAFNVLASHGYHLAKLNSVGETFFAFKGRVVVNIPDKAQEILGLDYKQRKELFDAEGMGWSTRARNAYDQSKTPKERAAAAAQAIDDFIAKYRAIEAYGKRLIPAVEIYAPQV